MSSFGLSPFVPQNSATMRPAMYILMNIAIQTFMEDVWEVSEEL